MRASRKQLCHGPLLLLFAAAPAIALDLLTPQQLQDTAVANAPEAIGLFREFLSLPNDALHPQDIAALNDWMLAAFADRGFTTQLIPTAGSPALFAGRPAPQATQTVLVYLQADGQPVDPTAWQQPNPYEPVLKAVSADGDWEILPWNVLDDGFDDDWRVFARSASDSKGPMTQFLMAVELLDRAGHDFDYNLKVIVDTEEELGSPNLAAAVQAHRELLSADMLLIFDGPPHASNRPTVSLGARGIATVTLTTYGPKVAQHSGHYGNFVPNPAFRLAEILASMKSPDGVVLVEGFYDGVVIDEATREVLEGVPDNEEAILASLGVAEPDSVATSLQESLQYPSLNIRGLSSAWTGAGARTIIPPDAVAELDIRLVLESDPERLIGLLARHIEDLGYVVLDHAPTDEERLRWPKIVRLESEISYGAFRSDPDSAPARMARSGLFYLYGEEPILIRTMGGSIPIAPIIDVLGVPAATVPTVNIDNNQHSPNENLRIGNFIEGIAILMSVLQQSPD